MSTLYRSHPVRTFLLLLSVCVLSSSGFVLAAPQNQQRLAEAERLNTQVVELYKAGKFSAAIPVAEQVLKIWEAELSPNHADIALGLTNLGDLNSRMGNKTAAKPLHQRALKIRERTLGQNHADTALSATYVAQVSESLGDYQAAEKHFKQALAIRERVFGTQHPEVASALNNIAHLLKTQGRIAEAEPLFLRGLEIRRKTQGSQHIDNAPSLDNLAAIYTNQGRFADAEPLYKQALKIRQAHFGPEHPDTLITLHSLAVMFDGVGRFEEAEQLYRNVLRVRRQVLGLKHPITVATLETLARHLERQRNGQSVDNYDLARRGIRGHVIEELPALSESEQSQFLKVNYENGLFEALSCALLRRDQQDVVAKSAGWVLNGKAVGREALAQRNMARRANAFSPKPVLWVEQEQLRASIPPGSVFVDIVRFNRVDFGNRQQGPSWRSPHYAAWITPAADAGDVQLIDLGPAEDIDALVKQARQQLLKAHGDEGEIAASSEHKAVTRLNAALQSLAELVWKPLAPHLGESKELLLSPDGDLWLFPWAALPVAENDADGDTMSLVEKYSLRLIVSGRDLIPKDVAAVSGPPVILANPEFNQSAGRKKQSIIGIFKKVPAADEDSLRAFSFKNLQLNALPLPNTEIEAISIEPQLEIYAGRGVRVFKQRYALESVAKELQGPKVAVFATHGFFLPKQQTELESGFLKTGATVQSVLLDQAGKPFENPLLRCGLLLSGCNQKGVVVGADDGILTGAEVAGLNLHGTDLVVLSACETGLGDINQGEGVAGLRQAFQLAGAQSVVASLWKVSDRETSLLISDFFRNLAAGQSKSAALRNAQLSRIETRRNRYGAAHPFYWAAFTLTGK